MKLGQVALTVSSLPQAVAFHRDVLGLPLLFEYPNLAFFDAGGVRLMLSEAASEAKPEPFVMYYRVDDLPTAWRSLIDKGATGEKEPHLIAKMPDHDLWMAFVRDPEGRLTGLMQEVKRLRQEVKRGEGSA